MTHPDHPGAHRVVIVGAGFGGLETAQGLRGVALRGAPVEITLIDRRNHHLFQPLLYQVATAALAPSEIAWPVRHLMRGRDDVTTLLGEVVGVDAAAKQVRLRDGELIPYDTLVVATGARHAYFGHDDWAPFAPGLKMLEDAVAVRGRILMAFEEAEREPDPAKRAALLTFVVIGAGPTGVELAGTIAEIAHKSLKGEFRRIDTTQARVVLVEAGDRVLPAFERKLSDYALRALERLGVEVELGRAVSACGPDGVTFGSTTLPAKVIIWAAGVQASPAAAWLGAAADKAGRVKLAPDLTIAGQPDVFVIGDTATLDAWEGRPVPGIAPAAKQQGKHVADTIRRRLAGDRTPRAFRYRHDGSLATIGKRAAVVDLGALQLTGWPAWWVWGLVHIYFLIGLRNRLAVALNWLWVYASGDRGARLITRVEDAL
ncbi:MAG: NAD(P)/FAD-dependent oxidoreductase [Hyphomonadaceae bacterium]|nr:NAD(P)/FAD-dependent oxidoreductase [Hyphomonadaceae bacterium]